ncbi:MAG: hypothetical protein BGN91_13145 [Nitrobacter sp. 62-13]|jgi:hypothetical protein|uniref:hypothetical protein n=1 Tax=Nitrobacter sp. 62-13 TaxID=1895797 RepID=UPI0009628347|nr:hypothetical protein [Nitrobacter sp. 62-13]OJU28323.1 MAG: hypothetical protein BGN91_13145 [Nitrobacter sp. 62-13]
MRKYSWKSGTTPRLDERLEDLDDVRPPADCASLPVEIEQNLRYLIEQALSRHGLPVAKEVVNEIVEEVSYAYAGRQHVLRAKGAGRPPNGTAMLLSVNVADLLDKHGIQGNWQQWPGHAGPVTELEAIAQTAFHLACDGDVGSLTRPARTSEARKTLGNIHRNDPLP